MSRRRLCVGDHGEADTARTCIEIFGVLASWFAYVPAVDPDQQWAIDGENSPRHRVRNNLPGTPEFCPLVFRTPALDQFLAMNLAERARAVVSGVPRDLLARTAAFLLLKDSKSSYVIESARKTLPKNDPVLRPQSKRPAEDNWSKAAMERTAPLTSIK